MLQLELLLFIRGLIQKNYEYGYRMHKKKNVPHNLLKFYLGLKNLNMSSVRIGGEKKYPFLLSHIALISYKMLALLALTS